jgi:hypothetical protein
MDGAKIGTIDTTMRELLPELVVWARPDADIRIAILTSQRMRVDDHCTQKRRISFGGSLRPKA